MKRRHRAATLALLLAGGALGMPSPLLAGYGAYTHGYGIKSLGYAGIGFVLPEETYTLASNPAGAVVMGNRNDYGLDYENFDGAVAYEGNLLGPDKRYRSREHHFFVPQIGVSRELSDRWSVGATAFFAGVGTDYKRSPYERFGAAPRAGVGLAMVGASLAAGYLVAPGQAIGISANLAYQELRVQGLDAATFRLISSDPEHLSDQGRDGRPGFGFTLGWLGALGPQLTGGLSYRSKTWTQRYREYAGLFPDRGRVELPAIYGAGLSWEFMPHWAAAFEYQRIEHGEESAFGNRFERVLGGAQLGAKDGPGFGWINQNVYKFGLSQQVSEQLCLRAGYARASANVPPAQTLLSALAPSFLRRHYTLGATWAWRPEWELSGYAAFAPRMDLPGEGSIPPLLAGGEADLHGRQFFFGLSFGRRFAD